MTMQEIGMESMPNVYISYVQIFDEDNIEVQVTVKDFFDNPTWAASQILRDKLKIKVLVLAFDIAGRDEVNKLNNGQITIHESNGNFQERSIYNFFIEDIVTEGNLTNYYYKFRFNRVNKSNIYIYTQAFVDVSELNLGFTDYHYLDGPMASEAVKINGETPENGFLFRTPDGAIWSGPVHGHQGDYMVGSYHTDEDHDKLKQETVDSKVLDFLSGLPT
jgi:hypothetical protein